MDAPEGKPGDGGGGISRPFPKGCTFAEVSGNFCGRMQKSLSELAALPSGELSRFLDALDQPLLVVTADGEPQFVAQSLVTFEATARRLRRLEEEQARKPNRHTTSPDNRITTGKIIPFPR